MKKVSFGVGKKLTSEDLNARFSDLAGGSILSGFRLIPGSSSYLISLVRGGEASQKLILPDGTKIEETGDALDVVAIRPNLETSNRIDVLYVAYVHEKDKTFSYELVEGVPGLPLDVMENERKLAIGYITVRPRQTVKAEDITSFPIGLNKIGRFGEVVKQVLFTTTEGQTVINLEYDFLVGQNRILLTIGGVKQFFEKDYTETGSRQLTMKEPLLGGLAGEVLITTSAKVLAEDFKRETDAAKQATIDAVNGAKAANEAALSTRMNWLIPVDTFSLVATTYPAAVHGDTVMVRDTGKVFGRRETTWIELMDLDPTPINEVDQRLGNRLNEKDEQLFYYVKTSSEFLTCLGNIKQAMKTNITSKVKIVLRAGNYTFSESIILPPYVRISVNGVVILRYSGTGPLFHVKYEDTLAQVNAYTNGFSQNPLHNGNVLDGSDGSLILKGLGTAFEQTALRLGDETITEATHRKHTAWTQFTNVFIDGFKTGFSFSQRETYIMTFNNITVSGCGTIIKDETPAVNAGEEIRWNNCNFHNSKLFLELGSEINHVFSSCSIDYNEAGVFIKNNRYATVRFLSCWIEASNTTGVKAFIESSNTNFSVVNIVMNACYLYPREKISDVMFKGKFKLIWSDNFVFLNRFISPLHNIGAGAMLCDDEVVVMSCKGTVFQEQKAVLSRYQALNRNSGFELDATGSTSVTGFSRQNNAGEASFVIDESKFFSGGKSLRVNTENGAKSFVNVITEKVPIRNAEQVYGQARVFFNEVKTYGVTVIITFYGEDKTTIIDSISNPQNITTTSSGQWKALMSGTVYDKPVPPRAVYVDYKITIGSLGSDCWIDDMVLAYL